MDERGFTLIELLVGMTILVVLMLASFKVLDSSTSLATRDNARTDAVREAKGGLDRMIRELRHTRLVNSVAPRALDVTVTQRGVDRRVVFDCNVAVPGAAGLRRCTRTVAGGATEILVDGVRATGADATIFTPTPAAGPRHVSVRLGFASTAVLTDGTQLRNVP